MSFQTVDDIVIVYDQMQQGDLINPSDWNNNFLAIETTENSNIQNINDNFALIASATNGASGADNVGSTPLVAGGSNTVQGQLEALKTQSDSADANLVTHKAGSDHDGRYYTETEVNALLEATVLGQVPDNSLANAKLAIDIKVGSLADLLTTVKTSVVGAVNEIFTTITAMSVTLGQAVADILGKADKDTTTILRTASYTLALTDKATVQKCLSADAIAVLIPTNLAVAFPVNSEIVFVRYGAGSVTLSGDVGVTLNSADAVKTISKQYEATTLKKIATDEWLLIGV